MGKTKQFLEESHSQKNDDGYFQLLSEKEWQDYIEKEISLLEDRFGNSLLFIVKKTEFLNKISHGK